MKSFPQGQKEIEENSLHSGPWVLKSQRMTYCRGRGDYTVTVHTRNPERHTCP